MRLRCESFLFSVWRTECNLVESERSQEKLEESFVRYRGPGDSARLRATTVI